MGASHGHGTGGSWERGHGGCGSTAGLGAPGLWEHRGCRSVAGWDPETRAPALQCCVALGAPTATRRQWDGYCGRAVKCRDLSVHLAVPGEDLTVA